MKSRDFCYWLQGYFEIAQAAIHQDQNGNRPAIGLNGEQLQIVRNHLNMVFKHEIDPSHGDAAHQEVLQAAHEGKPQAPAKRPPHSGSTILRC